MKRICWWAAGLAGACGIAQAATFLVTTNANDGAGSLRRAIQDANARPGRDTIAFNLPTNATIITPLSPLPALTDAVLIDGYSQAGARPNTNAIGCDAVLLVELDGHNAGAYVNGLTIRTNDCELRGLAIHGFGSDPTYSTAQIWIEGGRNNVVAGNFIGLRRDGVTAANNLPTFIPSSGVFIGNGANNTIGGLGPSERNLISGNRAVGALIVGAASTGNTLLGNFIGPDRTGLTAVTNGASGVQISAGGNQVGTAGAGNVISGNASYGVLLVGGVTVPASDNVVAGNLIGLGADGDRPLANGRAGVGLSQGLRNLIGGTAPGDRNVISGNRGDGILLFAAETAASTNRTTSANLIRRNLIGTDATGLRARANGLNGIELASSADTPVRGNEIGTSLAGPSLGNLISGNTAAGIALIGTNTSSTIVQGNLIGVDLTGRAALGNGGAGVSIAQQSHDNLIGGDLSLPVERNVISGNGAVGLYVNGPHNVIQGNLVGTDGTGTNALGNALGGLRISALLAGQNAASNLVGGREPGRGNVVAGNLFTGITVEGAGTRGTVIQGNRVGTDFAGQIALTNQGGGIRLESTLDTVIGAARDEVVTPATANLIAYNAANGITIAGDTAIGNTVRGNRIFGNGRFALALGLGTAITPNDAEDTDAGPNDLMNYPTSVSASFDTGANQTALSGWVAGADPGSIMVDLYASTKPGPAASGNGETYLASVHPDASGFFCTSVPGNLTGKVVTATATSPGGSTSAFSPAPRFRLRALEINQSVQDWANRLPLFTGKPTFVRAHLETMGPPPIYVTNVAELQPRLHGRRGGQALPGSPLSPLRSTDAVIPLDAGDARGDFDSTLNFRLPPTWCEGELELRFEGLGVACAEPDATPPATPACKQCGQTVTFEPPARLRLALCLVEHGPLGARQAATRTDAGWFRQILEAMYPIAVAEVETVVLQLNPGASPSPTNVNAKLLSLATKDPTRKYLGMIPGPVVGGYNGMAAGIPASCASGFFTVPYGPLRVTLLHELGHACGRPHAVLAPTLCTNPAPPLIETNCYAGACGERMSAADPLFPYSIGGEPSLGPTNLGPNAIVFGLDTWTGGNRPTVMDPNLISELMSYCKEARYDRWISKETYLRLHDYLSLKYGVGNGPSSRGAASLLDQPQPFLLVQGDLNLHAGTASFRPFELMFPVQPPALPEPGEHLLQMLDAAGSVRLEMPFAPIPLNSEEIPPKSGAFLLPVPLDPAYHEVRVLRRGALLARRIASPHAPTVNLAFPEAGITLSSPIVTLSWTGSDADGDPLTYGVDFSSDGGRSWRPLQGDWSGTTLEVDRSLLAGTSLGRLRITVSDGFWVGVTTSGLFTVADSPPEIRIRAPSAGEIVTGNQPVVLDAWADDVQDGRLTGTNIVWQSDLEGALGTGAMVVLQASNLTPGPHELSVTAWNRAGLSSSATTRLWVQSNLPPACAELELSLALGTDSPRVGDELTFHLAVRNHGPNPATEVRLTKSLPESFTFKSVETTAGHAQFAGGQIRCELGELPAGASVRVTIVAQATGAGTFPIHAAVGFTGTDPAPANNQAALTVSVQAPEPARPDLVVHAAADTEPVAVGAALNYTIEVANYGRAEATQVRLSNVLPSGWELESAAVSQGTWSQAGSEILAHIGTVAVGKAVTLQLGVRALSVGSFLVSASAGGEEEDAEPLDNVATVITTVVRISDFAVAVQGESLQLQWSASGPCLVEESVGVGPDAIWTASPLAPVRNGASWTVLIPPGTGTRFYRLRWP